MWPPTTCAPIRAASAFEYLAHVQEALTAAADAPGPTLTDRELHRLRRRLRIVEAVLIRLDADIEMALMDASPKIAARLISIERDIALAFQSIKSAARLGCGLLHRTTDACFDRALEDDIPLGIAMTWG